MRQSVDAIWHFLGSDAQGSPPPCRHAFVEGCLNCALRAMRVHLGGFVGDCAGRFARQPHHSLRIAILMLAWLFPSIFAFSAPTEPMLGNLFGPHRHDVAVKVAELPIPLRGDVLGLAFSPDDSRIAVESPAQNDANVVYVWNWRAGHLDTNLTTPKGGNTGLDKNPIQYSPDGRVGVTKRSQYRS